MSDRSAFMPFTYATEDGATPAGDAGGRHATTSSSATRPTSRSRTRPSTRSTASKYASVCKGTYALTVPFMTLFFALPREARTQAGSARSPSNSFMKREFGTQAYRGLSCSPRPAPGCRHIGRIHPRPWHPDSHYRGPKSVARSVQPCVRSWESRRTWSSGRTREGHGLEFDSRACRRPRLGRRLDYRQLTSTDLHSPPIRGRLPVAAQSSLRSIIEDRCLWSTLRT